MGLLDNFEKLINEHGSATILRERLELFRDQIAALSKENALLTSRVADLTNERVILSGENARLKLEISELNFTKKEEDQQIRQLKDSTHNDNPDGYACDHCGSKSLKRTGSRLDPVYAKLGVKQKLFLCKDCNNESAYTE